MKRLLVCLLVLAMALSLAACGGKENQNTGKNEESQNQTVTGQQPADSGSDVDGTAPAEDAGQDADQGPEVSETDPADQAGAEESGEAPEAKTITASHSDVTLSAAGNSFKLKAEGGAEDSVVTYSAADETVAVVKEDGTVTAVAPGTTTVTMKVTSGDEIHTFDCVVRCTWTEESQTGGEAAAVDLTAFYNDVTSQYEFGFLENLTGELLDNYYPGMSDISTQQQLIMGCMLSMNNGEFCLVEVTDSADVEMVKSIFQSRVDYMAGGGAWYPAPTEQWTNNSRIVSCGNYVMMIVHENCDDIVSAFQTLCEGK